MNLYYLCIWEWIIMFIMLFYLNIFIFFSVSSKGVFDFTNFFWFSAFRNGSHFVRCSWCLHSCNKKLDECERVGRLRFKEISKKFSAQMSFTDQKLSYIDDVIVIIVNFSHFHLLQNHFTHFISTSKNMKIFSWHLKLSSSTYLIIFPQIIFG